MIVITWLSHFHFVYVNNGGFWDTKPGWYKNSQRYWSSSPTQEVPFSRMILWKQKRKTIFHSNVVWYLVMVKLSESKRFCHLFSLLPINQSNRICDWIWKNPDSTHNYKYLEIPILIIWNIITWEGKQMLAWNLPRFYSYLYSIYPPTIGWIASWISHYFR